MNEDTYFLKYIESARDVILRAVKERKYGIHRNTATFTDTYVHADRRVAVRYDENFKEVVEVKVIMP